VARHILSFAPGHGDANLLEGQLLLDQGDPAGLDFLERAMASDPASTIPACQLAARLHESRGETAASDAAKARAEARRRAEQDLSRERAHVRPSDVLSAPDCSGETAAALLRAVQRHRSHIRAAYLFKKCVAGGEKRPLYVLGVERKVFPWQNAARANRLLLRRISDVPGIPSEILVCVITRANRALLAKWKSLPGALLWSPASSSAAESAPLSVLPPSPRAVPRLRGAPLSARRAVPQTPAPAK